MIFVVAGLVILVISFAVALISLVREQSKVNKETAVLPQAAADVSAKLSSKSGGEEQISQANPKEDRFPQIKAQEPFQDLPQSLSFEKPPTDEGPAVGSAEIDKLFGRGEVLTTNESKGLSGEWVNPRNSSIK